MKEFGGDERVIVLLSLPQSLSEHGQLLSLLLMVQQPCTVT